MVEFTEGFHTGEHLVSEANGYRSREVGIITGGKYQAGTMLGQITVGDKEAAGEAGVPAPAAATITAAPVAGAAAKVGVHTFRCIVGGSATASKWQHIDPDGEYVGVATGNTEYSGGGISGLTITDAGTDPVAGETFIVTVTMEAASMKYTQLDPDATDGSQHFAAVLYEGVDASENDVAATIHVRECEVNGRVVTWIDDITDGEKAAAVAEAAALGIIVRN